MKLKFLYIFAAALLMGAGKVQTRDGKTLEGDVAFEAGAVVVRSPVERRIAFEQVARVIMDARSDSRIAAASARAKLPEGWKSQDIGKVKYPGSATCDDRGGFKLTASGWGAWGGTILAAVLLIGR